MIRFIAAVDSKLGIADDHGIPWQGKLPIDVKYFHEKISHSPVLMGLGLYKELSKPYPGGVNYVATTHPAEISRPGFEPVEDAVGFLKSFQGDIWNLGGAVLFSSTLDLADELYLTHIDADFNCTKFFPSYTQDFEQVSQSDPMEENELHFTFNIYRRKQSN